MIKVYCWDTEYPHYIQWLEERRIRELFLKHGIKLIFSDPHHTADALLGNWMNLDVTMPKFLDMPYKVKFIMEAHDGTFPRTADVCLQHKDTIKGIFKHSIFRDFVGFHTDYPVYTPAGHFELIARDYPELRDEPYAKSPWAYKKYSKEDLEYINSILHIGCPLLFQPPYLLREHLDVLTEKDIMNNDRDIDVFMSATIRYNDAPHLTFVQKHRQGMMRMLKELSSEFNIVAYDESHRCYCGECRSLALRSKIMVSPYGIGSFSYRDWEVLMFGCEGIRPYTDYMKTYPDIYDPQLKAFNQPKDNLNMDELRGMIFRLKSEYCSEKNMELRLRKFRLLKDAADNHEPLVNNMANVIKSALNK